MSINFRKYVFCSFLLIFFCFTIVNYNDNVGILLYIFINTLDEPMSVVFNRDLTSNPFHMKIKCFPF